MADQGYQSFFVTEDYIRVKFNESIGVVKRVTNNHASPTAYLAKTLTSGNFTVYDTSASPNNIINPFKEIDLAKDWISTSRQLHLYWNFQLQPGQTYRIESKNLITPFDTLVTEQLVATIVVDDWFTSPPGPPGVESRPTREVAPLDVEDYSIKNPPFTEGATSGSGESSGGTGGTADPSAPFTVISITPPDIESYQLEPQAFEGKIVVEFNKPPASNYLNNSDFKLQRKPLEGVASWENVNTKVLADSSAPKVNVYLPSQGSIPTYSYEGIEGEDAIFWVKGYKYRLVISKYIGV